MADAATTETTKARREAVAAEVRAELSRQKQTQREAAHILGLPQSAVNLRLAGIRAFKAEELALLAEAWGIPITKLYPEAAAS